MSAFIPIAIHETQWPSALSAQLQESLRTRQLNPKFHYHSPRQVLCWLRLHEVVSPARQADSFRSTYERAFETVTERLGRDAVHLVGLGCGGGYKEAALLERLATNNRSLVFSAADVSPGLVVTALQAAREHVNAASCSGLVCDLTLAADLELFFEPRDPPGARRVITCFGMIPNFEPGVIQALWKRMLRPGDLLLCSANLAPGPDYRQGVEQVLSQYDNALTRDWLQILLSDLGIKRDGGEMRFDLEEVPANSGLFCITATYTFREPGRAIVEREEFEFEAGTQLRLFFSYRHTGRTLEHLVKGASLTLLGSWIDQSGEEGVFLGGLPRPRDRACGP